MAKVSRHYFPNLRTRREFSDYNIVNFISNYSQHQQPAIFYHTSVNALAFTDMSVYRWTRYRYSSVQATNTIGRTVLSTLTKQGKQLNHYQKLPRCIWDEQDTLINLCAVVGFRRAKFVVTEILARLLSEAQCFHSTSSGKRSRRQLSFQPYILHHESNNCKLIIRITPLLVLWF